MNWNKLIKKYDKSDYLGKILSFPDQCKEGWHIGKEFKFSKPNNIEKIFVTGMGGSGYSAELLQKLNFMESDIPVFIEHGYILPKYVDEKTLCIAISHSGNTEETLSIFKKLKEKKIPTIGIATNGELGKICENCIVVPGGLQPRQSTGYLFFSMLGAMHNLGLCQFSEKEVLGAINLMESEKKELNEKAKALAEKIYKKMPVIYSSEKLQATALRWQQELNEIGKAFCHWNFIPELQHNEINAAFNLGKAHFIFLKTRDEEKRILARFEFMRKRIPDIGYEFTDIETKGESTLAQNWHGNILGSLVAFYLSMLNKVDPTPVDLISGMKNYLSKRF